MCINHDNFLSLYLQSWNFIHARHAKADKNPWLGWYFMSKNIIVLEIK